MLIGPSWRVTTLTISILLATGWPSAARQQARAAAPAQAAVSATLASAAPARVSKRNANYSIDVELDPETRTLQGREVLTWRNISTQPATELQFHLYYNAWTNSGSTWMRERAAARTGRTLDDPRPGDWVDLLKAIRCCVLARTIKDLTASRGHRADDGNPGRFEPSGTCAATGRGASEASESRSPGHRRSRAHSREGVVEQLIMAQWFRSRRLGTPAGTRIISRARKSFRLRRMT